jgi:hypothetical protein
VKDYTRSEPLIFIHTPKSGGTTTKEAFSRWFKGAFYQHYFNEVDGSMPEKIGSLSALNGKKPLVIYGHFNKLKPVYNRGP